MAHITVPAAEEILDKQFPVLDKGFITLVDYMGGDDRIVTAARISTNQGLKSPEEDRKLIHYLIKNRHSSPLEMCELIFHVKLPIFVAREWIRHRTANVNEMSGRYVQLANEFYLPELSRIRYQSKSNKQASADDMPDQETQRYMLNCLLNHQDISYQLYDELVKDNIAKEVARINLPLSIYTQWYWKIDLHNCLHFLKLRMASNAQWEIGQYANQMAGMVKAVAPIIYQAFEEYVLNALTLPSTLKDDLINYLGSIAIDTADNEERTAKDLLVRIKKL